MLILLRKFKFHRSLTRITGTLHEDLCAFVIISRSILLRSRNVPGRSCRENQNTHFIFNNFFFRKSCRLWDNVEKYGTARQATDGNIITRMRIACWITKARDTRAEYVILIAFPRQQWLRERPSVLRSRTVPVWFQCCPCPQNAKYLPQRKSGWWIQYHFLSPGALVRPAAGADRRTQLFVNASCGTFLGFIVPLQLVRNGLRYGARSLPQTRG
jgi:hypothetical protein